MKTCNRCGRQLPEGQFYRNGSRLRPECKECTLARQKERLLADPERHERKKAYWRDYGETHAEAKQAYKKHWYSENRDTVIAKTRQWSVANGQRRTMIERRYRDRNRERVRESHASWVARNPTRHKAQKRAAKARRREAPMDLFAQSYVAVLVADPCSYCGAPSEHIDHIDALASGGDSAWNNLTAACADCNMRKSARSLLDHLHISAR